MATSGSLEEFCEHLLGGFPDVPSGDLVKIMGEVPRILDRSDSIEADGTSSAGYPVVRFTRRFGAQVYTVALEIRGDKTGMLAVQNM